jgi:hypothetical protein
MRKVVGVCELHRKVSETNTTLKRIAVLKKNIFTSTSWPHGPQKPKVKRITSSITDAEIGRASGRRRVGVVVPAPQLRTTEK